jgi:hypothetical protein
MLGRATLDQAALLEAVDDAGDRRALEVARRRQLMHRHRLLGERPELQRREPVYDEA